MFFLQMKVVWTAIDSARAGPVQVYAAGKFMLMPARNHVTSVGVSNRRRAVLIDISSVVNGQVKVKESSITIFIGTGTVL